jgi:cytochrome c oxidase subunit IV
MSKAVAVSAAKGHAHPNYWAILGWLFVLTIAEIAAALIPIGPSYPHAAKALLLVTMALTKAALVGLYFMHLRFEKRTLGLIAVTPLFLCVFLLFMLLPDTSPF